jgi:hypothetical protein
MAKNTSDTPTEKVKVENVSDHMRWIKVGGAWRGEGDTYPDGLPRWIPESTIINPKADSALTADHLVEQIYKGGWKFGPMLSNGHYGILIVYREKVE